MSPKEKIAQNMIIDYYKKQYGMVADSKDKNINKVGICFTKVTTR